MTQPTVSIITYTGQWCIPVAGKQLKEEQEFAARLLAFTKNTRLQMTPDGFDVWLNKPWEEIEKELAYMATTIPSAWEFVDITFSIQNVSRACAQQITRTRNASYQMQSQRVTDMSGVTFHVPESVKDKERYTIMMGNAINQYAYLADGKESLEDARGLLPMNVHCNLLAKYNLRALVDLLRARDSLRVQGEYHEIARQMKAETLRIWPWATPFFVPKEKHAIDLIEDVAKTMKEAGVSGDLVTKLAKASDLLKK